MGWAAANAVPSLGKRDRALVTWAGVVPDIDGLGIIADGLTRNSSHPLHFWGDYHHILCHNVGFAILIVAIIAIFAKQRVIAALLAALSFHLHLLSDLIGARGPDGDQWPIPYLLPFSRSAQWVWSGQWALNAWQNFVITGVLIGIMLIIARQRGISPLEMVSARANDIFVRALRARFPLE